MLRKTAAGLVRNDRQGGRVAYSATLFRGGCCALELKSLSRGLQLLEILSRGPQTQGVTDLARAMDVDKSTVSRLLKTLQRHGYVEQDKTSRGYGMGPGYGMGRGFQGRGGGCWY